MNVLIFCFLGKHFLFVLHKILMSRFQGRREDLFAFTDRNLTKRACQCNGERLNADSLVAAITGSACWVWNLQMLQIYLS